VAGILSTANGLLGYSGDARLLIVNADDFGMSAAVNQGVLGAIRHGVAQAASLMAPWPGAAQAMAMLRDNPDVSFGVHLSVICDLPGYRYGPVAPAGAVPSLTDGAGYFYQLDRRAELVARAELGECETEFRAQIQAVLAAGLRPGHLDWHCLADGGRPDIFELTLRLAREYGLAIRVHDVTRAAPLRAAGLPVNDHAVLDSYRLDPAGKTARYLRLLTELPAGLTEWALHPAVDTAELRETEPASWPVRVTDYEFLVCPEARQVIEGEGIILLSHEPLRRLWAASRPLPGARARARIPGWTRDPGSGLCGVC
jgi:chitin disaccharide deacetylase